MYEVSTKPIESNVHGNFSIAMNRKVSNFLTILSQVTKLWWLTRDEMEINPELLTSTKKIMVLCFETEKELSLLIFCHKGIQLMSDVTVKP